MFIKENKKVDSSYYDKEILVGEFEKSETKKVRISVGYKGENNAAINIREFYKDRNDEWRPGKQGILVNDEEIEDLIKGLQEALSIVE